MFGKKFIEKIEIGDEKPYFMKMNVYEKERGFEMFELNHNFYYL